MSVSTRPLRRLDEQMPLGIPLFASKTGGFHARPRDERVNVFPEQNIPSLEINAEKPVV